MQILTLMDIDVDNVLFFFRRRMKRNGLVRLRKLARTTAPTTQRPRRTLSSAFL